MENPLFVEENRVYSKGPLSTLVPGNVNIQAIQVHEVDSGSQGLLPVPDGFLGQELVVLSCKKTTSAGSEWKGEV